MKFKWETDVEQPNRGWVVHKITAYSNQNDYLGYMKTSYIPSENMERFLPTPFHVIDAVRGSINGFYDYRNQKPIALKDPEHVKKQATSLLRIAPRIGWHKQQKIRKEYKGKYDKLFDKISDDCLKKIQPDYQDFKDFHIDKPIVDYVNVNKKYRRMGVGMAIYVEMAKRLQRNFSMPLYASGVQSSDAEHMWKYLEHKSPNGIQIKHTKDGRKFIQV